MVQSIIHNMNYEYNDGGKAYYNVTHDTQDCVVRALSITLQGNYLSIREKLLPSFPSMDTLGINIHHDSIVSLFRLNNLICVEGRTTMDAIPHGRVIAHTDGHVTAIINGVIQDVRNESNKVVSRYWVLGTWFDVYLGTKKLNLNPMGAKDALRMRQIYLTNYGNNVHLKAV